jgi:hypothetical protein
MTNQQAETRPFTRGECEPARRGEAGRFAVAGEFGDNPGQRAAAQSLFHGPEHIGGARHPQDQQPRRRQPELVEARTVRSTALAPRKSGCDPKHLAAHPRRAGRQRQDEPAGRRQMHGRGRSKLMQHAAGEPAAERGIDGRAEADLPLPIGQPGAHARIDPRQRLTEMAERGRRRSRAHGNLYYVHALF